MSFMRHPVYAWSDGKWMHLWARTDADKVQAFDPGDFYPGFDGGIEMRQEVFDALVLLRYAQLINRPNRLRRAVKLARAERGNFGSFEFQEALGGDPVGDFKRRMEKARAGRGPQEEKPGER